MKYKDFANYLSDYIFTGEQGEKGSPGEKGRTGGFGFPGIYLF